jgi:hypothetical protein
MPSRCTDSTMRYITQFALAACLWTLTVPLYAAPTADATRNEINALLTALQSSGCDFNRNGSWYSGPDARAHLQKKFEYLEKSSALTSTEQFIALGASQSSSSGQAYLVRCPGAPALESKVWLNTQLKVLRSQK